MKLADIDQSRFDIIDEATVIIEKLSKNEDFKSMLFKDDLNFKGDAEAAKQILNKRVLSNIPKLMNSAKTELTEYFALLEGVPVDEYLKDFTFGKAFNGVVDMLNDTVFLNFFYSYQSQL